MYLVISNQVITYRLYWYHLHLLTSLWPPHWQAEVNQIEIWALKKKARKRDNKIQEHIGMKRSEHITIFNLTSFMKRCVQTIAGQRVYTRRDWKRKSAVLKSNYKFINEGTSFSSLHIINCRKKICWCWNESWLLLFNGFQSWIHKTI